MKDIILDTNFIISAIKYKIDIQEELSRIFPVLFRICVLDSVLIELKKLTKSPTTRLEAVLGLKITSPFYVIKTENKNVDYSLVELSKNKGVVVATNDKELKEKLSCPVIVIRNRKYFELIN